MLSNTKLKIDKYIFYVYVNAVTAPPGPMAIAIEIVRDFIWSNIPIIHPILKVLSI